MSNYDSEATSPTTSSTSSSDISISNVGNYARIRQRQRRPPSPPIQSIGADPSILAGKVLKHIRRSFDHPSMTLTFGDGTVFEIRVDGYDPRHKGVPKVLEITSPLQHLFNPPGGFAVFDMTVEKCVFTRMQDHAFEAGPREQFWIQKHLGIAFKFENEGRMWHSIAAMLEVRDEETHKCTLRNFKDVYLHPVSRSKGNSKKKSAGTGGKKKIWRY